MFALCQLALLAFQYLCRRVAQMAERKTPDDEREAQNSPESADEGGNTLPAAERHEASDQNASGIPTFVWEERSTGSGSWFPNLWTARSISWHLHCAYVASSGDSNGKGVAEAAKCDDEPYFRRRTALSAKASSEDVGIDALLPNYEADITIDEM